MHIPIQAPVEFTEKYHEYYHSGWAEVRQQRRDRAAAMGLIPADAAFVDMATTEAWQELSAEQRAYSARLMAVYAGMLDAMDHHIGRLVQHLKDIGEYDNTVFIFLSDNGAEPSDPLNTIMGPWVMWNFSTALNDLGRKGSYAAIGPSWASAAASPGGFFKFYAGEGGVRVPLIMSWPGHINGGKTEHSFAHVKDLVPTVLELSQTPDHNGNYQGRAVEPITGSSLLPVLQGRAEYTHAADKPIGYELSGNAALYKGDYKLLRNLPPMGDGEWHLYNMRQDPGEVNDLRDSMPERYQTMLADYEAYAAENGVQTMPEGYEYKEQLKKYARPILLKLWWPQLLLGALVLAGFVWLMWRLIRRVMPA